MQQLVDIDSKELSCGVRGEESRSLHLLLRLRVKNVDAPLMTRDAIAMPIESQSNPRFDKWGPIISSPS